MFLAVATGGMERITGRQCDLGAIRIERDAAQFFNRPRGGYCFVQAKPLEHRIGPVEKPLVAVSISSRVVLGVL